MNKYHVILDFDRTLVDSDALAKKIYTAVERYTGIAPENIAIKQRELEASSDASFHIIDMWAVIESFIENTDTKRLLEEHVISEVSLQRSELWLPGAETLLGLLRSQSQSFCILTTGAPLWQSIKLRCMELGSIPVRFISNHDKQIILQDMKAKDGTFVLPPDMSEGGVFRVVEELIQIDDRSAALGGAIDGVSALWVKTGRDVSENPGNVTHAFDTLEDAVEHIEKRILNVR